MDLLLMKARAAYQSHPAYRSSLRGVTPPQQFRDGNGRCARLLAVLMGLQAGLPVLDFGGVRGEEKRRYIAAIHAALGRDYALMTAVFERIVARTLRAARASGG